MLERVKGVLNPLRAGAKLLRSKAITYDFPPNPPLTESFRGRQLYNPETCKSCSLCAKVCPNKAIEMVEREKDGEKVLQPQIDFRKCCFCGLCAEICPTGALQLTNFPFLLTMNNETLVYPPEKLAQVPELEHPEPPKIKGIVSWARSRSLWITFYFTGCCFIEAVPWLSSGFDMERFGLLMAHTPRHADVLIVGGYVTVKTVKRIMQIYSQMPQPKWVIALGNCPMTGGTYWDSYNTIKRIDEYIPVDIWIAGCPPRPEPIGVAVVHAIHAIQNGYTGKEERVGAKKHLKIPEIEEEKVTGAEEGCFIPFGPQHPSSANFHMGLNTVGETVKEAVVYPGYLHRGFEKLMEYRTWVQNIMIVQRINVLDGAPYEIGYCEAVEEIAGIEPPRRAKYLRVIQAELSRIQSHLLNIGLIAGAAGLEAMPRILWGDREKILLLLEHMTGGRVYQIYNTPGGVRRDIKPNFKDLVNETIAYMRKRLELYDKLCFDNGIFRKRTMGIGRFTAETAEKHGIVGPNLRGCGVNFDIRKKVPYEAYGDLDFEVPTATEGDAYHRVLCRRLEMEESFRIIEQALDRLPGGSVAEPKMKNGKKLKAFSAIPEGEAIRCVESARGELCFHAVSDGGKNPYRVKVRGPAFESILILLPKLLKNVNIADVPVIYWSMDNAPADHDR